MIKDKEYWRNKKREQRAKAAEAKAAVTEKVGWVGLAEVEHAESETMAGLEERIRETDPEGYEVALWRAERARVHAAMFPEHVRPSEECFGSVVWQYVNEAVKAVPAVGERVEKMREEFKVAGVDGIVGERHPVYPELRKVAGREYDAGGLVLRTYKCETCERTWGATTQIECPYCHGKGRKAA